MSVRRLVLLRHGRTAWNAQHRFQGHADPPLDDVGLAQAAAVADLVAHLRPQLLVSSDATRATQTAQVVAPALGLTVRVDGRLRERGLGRWEGLTSDQVEQRYPDEYQRWSAGDDAARRGGETRVEVAERVIAAVCDLPDVESALLVMHGASAMALTIELLGIDQRQRPLMSLDNCRWTELEKVTRRGDEPGWRVRAHNVGAPAIATAGTTRIIEVGAAEAQP